MCCKVVITLKSKHIAKIWKKALQEEFPELKIGIEG